MRPIGVLLVEDNPADLNLIRGYFRDSGFNLTLEHVVDGAEALNYLYQKEKYENVSLPDIIVLDLNLPKIDGMKVLEIIKDDSNLKKIPVIVFGTSSDPTEVKKAYKNYSNCYIVKPIDFIQFENKLRSIEQFWFEIVTLPNL